MSSMFVLDAYALIALLRRENGAEAVEKSENIKFHWIR